ncbi:hypothetical protein [Sulfuriflexus mobilis]|uniref:hypothetical protein n=1 Tax=Sulfuriflexus mobilis TaxID=1811807 RepID=UPI000F81DB20|nr:hypothetical protein [Sulfuriflexus mobilis]
MTYIRIILLIGIILASTLIIYHEFAADLIANKPGSDTGPAIVSKNTPPRTEPLDVAGLPNNVDKITCLLGNPVLVSKSIFEPDTRYLFFRGPFTDSSDHDNPVAQYMYLTLDTIDANTFYSRILANSLEHYQGESIPEEIDQVSLPRVDNIPDRLSALTRQLGQWDYEHIKKDPDRRRVIYKRKICIGTQLALGMYFDIVDDTRIVNAKGMLSEELVWRVVSNTRKPKINTAPVNYLRNIPEAGTALDVMIKVILLRESGKQAEALGHVSKEQQNAFIRNDVTRQAVKGMPIKLDSLTYQLTKYAQGNAYVAVGYSLQDGSLIRTKHKLVLEDDAWRVKY